MSELLTTGQMIGKLNVGEVAERVTDDKTCFTRIRKFPSGDICWISKKDKFISTVTLESIVNGAQWRILPTYVTFEEAMKALKEGKTVYFKGDEKDPYHDEYKITPQQAKQWRLSALTIHMEGILDLYNGKWTVGDSK